MQYPHFVALFTTIILAISAAPAIAQARSDPSEEALQAAINAFAELGATYRNSRDIYVPLATNHFFDMPDASTDDDLKKLPKVPFPYGLSVRSTQITDRGLKELTRCANLVDLDLANTVHVTDAGLKELEGCKDLQLT